jgi:hypothetical protein
MAFNRVVWWMFTDVSGESITFCFCLLGVLGVICILYNFVYLNISIFAMGHGGTAFELMVISVSLPRGHSAAGRSRLIEKSNDLIGNRTRDLPACSIVPQPTTLPCAPSLTPPDI